METQELTPEAVTYPNARQRSTFLLSLEIQSPLHLTPCLVSLFPSLRFQDLSLSAGLKHQSNLILCWHLINGCHAMKGFLYVRKMYTNQNKGIFRGEIL